ncbi:MAG: type II toxin-antitoxin system VapC family toxin [Gemmatimonadales bacterium]|nr:type II toxin-antitoxin system VapC family toxin [Gemmatimonadales bacterium]MDZ4388133.1 type II toxin-antitoxin system VapC family toxin [Gemmatimonadales bacterium]
MKLLLDTHIWLWSLLEPERLTPSVQTALRDPDTEIWLSPISIWEAILLVERGRITIAGDPRIWVREMVHALPRREAPLTHDVAIMSRQIDLAHQDPADRFLAATAIVFDLTLVTADERLLAAPDLPVLANR